MGGRTGPKTPQGRERALANLLPFRDGHVQSGAYATLPVNVIEAKVEEIRAIAAGNATGWLKESDLIAVSLLARVLARLEAIDRSEAVDRWLRGQLGRAKVSSRMPAFVTMYLRCLETAHKLCDGLGLTPLSRKRLGVAALSEATALDTIRARYAPSRASDGPQEASE